MKHADDCDHFMHTHWKLPDILGIDPVRRWIRLVVQPPPWVKRDVVPPPRTLPPHTFWIQCVIVNECPMTVDRDPPRAAIRHIIAAARRVRHRTARDVETELAYRRHARRGRVIRLVGRIVGISRCANTPARRVSPPAGMADLVSHGDLTTIEPGTDAARLTTAVVALIRKCGGDQPVIEKPGVVTIRGLGGSDSTIQGEPAGSTSPV